MINELLAPAGSLDAVKVVIDHGADAVYCSGIKFGARSFITNLTNEDIIEASNYVHLFNKKIYITLNTLIYEDEIEEVKEYIDFLYQYVDAIIVQDFGVLHYIRKTYPDFPVHVSTQMSIHNRQDILFLKSLGVSRIVLAREVSIDEIKEFNKLGIELEIFIHGALCFSYSGMCYLSYYKGGRSGNRGSCAQPCRQDYELLEDNIKIKEGPLLSMKDLNVMPRIEELLSLGVTSLKIEGRAKSVEYQASVVDAYRKFIDQYNENKKPNLSETELDRLYASYSRERTLGYLFNDNNKQVTTDNSVRHQGILIGKVTNYYKGQAQIKLVKELVLLDGIRIIDDNKETGLTVTRIIENNQLVKRSDGLVYIDVKDYVKPGSLVYKTQSQEVKDYVKRFVNPYKNDAILYIFIKNERQELRVEVNEIYVSKLFTFPLEKAKTDKKEEYIKQFTKTNNLPINYVNVIYHNDDDLFLPLPLINKMRRSILLDLEKALSNVKREIKYKPYPYQKDKYNKERIVDELVIDETTNNAFDLINSHQLKKQDIAYHLSEINPSSAISPYFGVSNSLAVSFFRNFTNGVIIAGYESTLENTIKLSSLDSSIGYLSEYNEPLMVSKHCVVAKAKGYDHKKCLSCLHHSYALKDRTNIYPLKFKNCMMFIKGKSVKRISYPSLIDVKEK